MSKRIEELLAVLGLPEEGQLRWVAQRFPDERWSYPNRRVLADLAFRLRDEVANGKAKIAGGDLSAWYAGLKVVEGYLNETDAWLMHRSRPIEWIVAALIAKELAK